MASIGAGNHAVVAAVRRVALLALAAGAAGSVVPLAGPPAGAVTPPTVVGLTVLNNTDRVLVAGLPTTTGSTSTTGLPFVLGRTRSHVVGAQFGTPPAPVAFTTLIAGDRQYWSLSSASPASPPATCAKGNGVPSGYGAATGDGAIGYLTVMPCAETGASPSGSGAGLAFGPVTYFAEDAPLEITTTTATAAGGAPDPCAATGSAVPGSCVTLSVFSTAAGPTAVASRTNPALDRVFASVPNFGSPSTTVTGGRLTVRLAGAHLAKPAPSLHLAPGGSSPPGSVVVNVVAASGATTLASATSASPVAADPPTSSGAPALTTTFTPTATRTIQRTLATGRSVTLRIYPLQLLRTASQTDATGHVLVVTLKPHTTR